MARHSADPTTVSLATPDGPAICTVDDRYAYWPARVATASGSPWVPSDTPGKSARLLRFLPDGAGFVELLRMEPGVAMPLHRHSGEIHAYNLSGSRQLCTGEVIGPGDYVFEPAGNTDWWRVVGDEPSSPWWWCTARSTSWPPMAACATRPMRARSAPNSSAIAANTASPCPTWTAELPWHRSARARGRRP